MKRLTVVYVLILGAIILLVNWGVGQPLVGWAAVVPGGDKTVHFLLLGLLSFMVNMTLRARRVHIGPLPLLEGTLLVGAAATLEELSQLLLQWRDFSLLDLLADYLGIFLAGRLALLIVRYRQLSRGDN